MSELKANFLLLKEWRQEDRKTVALALQALTPLKDNSPDELALIAARLADFHKEIVRAKEEEVDAKWFELVIGLKKKVRAQQEAQEKARKSKVEKKPPPIIHYPEALLRSQRPADQRILQVLYRGFICGFEEGAKSPQTPVFLHYLLRELKHLFRHKTEEALHKRVNSISHRLERPTAV
jgi:DNA-directed RNA polymerase subunit M/transcription elongation factor TFIIS